MTLPYRFRTPQSSDTHGPYVSDFAIVGPPVGRATRPPAGPTAGNPAYSNPAYSLETKGRWYYSTTKSLRRAVSEIVFLFVLIQLHPLALFP